MFTVATLFATGLGTSLGTDENQDFQAIAFNSLEQLDAQPTDLKEVAKRAKRKVFGAGKTKDTSKQKYLYDALKKFEDAILNPDQFTNPELQCTYYQELEDENEIQAKVEEEAKNAGDKEMLVWARALKA